MPWAILLSHSLGISSTTCMQCVPEAAKLGEIMQNKGHYVHCNYVPITTKAILTVCYSARQQ